MDTGFTQEKLFVCLGPNSCFSFLVNPFPPSSPSLSPSFLSIFLAPLAQRGTTVCRERSYPLDLAPELLIYFIFSSIFLLSAIFFYRPPPPFRCHFSSSPQNHFHLSSHTNILTEFLLVREKEWKKQESKGMVQDCIFHQSELWENVHKQIEKYRYARGVKMSKEVEGKINILMCMHVCAHTHTHTHIHNKVCF